MIRRGRSDVRRFAVRMAWMVTLASALLAAGGGQAGQEIALPVWKEEDTSRFVEPGSTLLGNGLWPSEMLPVKPAAQEGKPRAEGDAKEKETERRMRFQSAKPSISPADIHVPDMTLLPHEMERASPSPALESVEIPVEMGTVPEALHPAYFGERPRGLLVDPQQMLSEQKRNDVERFLEYLQGDSAFSVYALIFAPNQEFPAGISLEELHRQWFGDEPVVLVAYYLGQPERASLEPGDRIREAIGRDIWVGVLESSIEEGRQAQNPSNQLERFCIELSIRLYWLEKDLPQDPPVTALADGAGASPVADAAPEEIVPPRDWIWGGAGLAGAAMFGLFGAAYWRFYRLPRLVFEFPDCEFAPSLQAPHCGGAHAVMCFGRRDAELVFSESGRRRGTR